MSILNKLIRYECQLLLVVGRCGDGKWLCVDSANSRKTTKREYVQVAHSGFAVLSDEEATKYWSDK